MRFERKREMKQKAAQGLTAGRDRGGMSSGEDRPRLGMALTLAPAWAGG